MGNWTPGRSEGRTVTPRKVQSQAARDWQVRFPALLSGTHSYDGGHTSYEKYIRGGCTLAYNSTNGNWAPTKRTRANGAGAAVTALVVDNAVHFRAGDSITVGSNTAQAIVSIVYSTNTITLTSAITWADDDEVYVSGYDVARLVLLDDEANLWNDDKSAYVDKTVVGLVAGLVDQSVLLGDVDTIFFNHLPSMRYLREIILDDTQLAIDLPPDHLYVAASKLVKPGVDKRTQVALTDTATVTAAQLLNKVIDGTPTGAATYTLPTAALLVAAIPGCEVGDSFDFSINNKSGGANTITVAAGSGGTADGTLTVAQHVNRRFQVTITNVTGASEAYIVYGQG